MLNIYIQFLIWLLPVQIVFIVRVIINMKISPATVKLQNQLNQEATVKLQEVRKSFPANTQCINVWNILNKNIILVMMFFFGIIQTLIYKLQMLNWLTKAWFIVPVHQ